MTRLHRPIAPAALAALSSAACAQTGGDPQGSAEQVAWIRCRGISGGTSSGKTN